MAKHIIPEKLIIQSKSHTNLDFLAHAVSTPAKLCSNACLKLKGSVVCACVLDAIKSPSSSLLLYHRL